MVLCFEFWDFGFGEFVVLRFLIFRSFEIFDFKFCEFGFLLLSDLGSLGLGILNCWEFLVFGFRIWGVCGFWISGLGSL